MLQDLRYALRQLRAAPGLSAVIVLSVALGVGANTAIFSLVHSVILARLPVKDPGDLVMLAWAANEFPKGLKQSGIGGPRDTGFRSGSYSLAFPFFRELQADSGGLFSAVFGFAPLGTDRQNTTVVVGRESMRVDGEMVAGDYFGGLGVPLRAGRAFAPGEHAVVISHRFWQSRFSGDPGAIGRSIAVNGLPLAIVGVAPPEFSGVQPGRQPDIWVPALDSPALTPWGFRPAGTASLMDARTYWWLPTMARLKPGVTREQVRASLEGRFAEFAAGTLGAADARVAPHLLAVPAGRGLDVLRRRFERPLQILMAVVALVLLIACANVATLLLARSTTRRREIAIRLSLGASRARLVRQLLTESVLVAVAGGALGLLLAAWGSRALVLVLPPGQQPDAGGGLPLAVLAFTAGVSILTGLVFGVVPALRATRFEVAADLKPSIGAGRGGRTLGGGFVVAQVALSLVLVFGAGLFVRTLIELEAQDLGVDARRVLVVAVDATQQGYTGARLTTFYDNLLERMQRLPGVVNASCSRLALFSGWISNGAMSIAGAEPKPGDMDIHRHAICPSFPEAMGMAMKAGRAIDWNDFRAARRVTVVNEAAAQYFFGGITPALGQRIALSERYDAAKDYEIVGVIQNAKYANVRAEAPRTAYVPFTAGPSAIASVFFELRTAGDPLSVVPAVRRAAQELDPNFAIGEVRTEESQIEESLWQERLFAGLVSAFGGLALLLACVGVYGTMSYAVTRRTREIGLRLAIGARRGDVLRLVLGSALKLAAIGVLAGVPLTLGLSRLVGSLLYGVKPADPATLAAAVTILAVVIAIAGFWPARRASRVDPMIALRTE